MTTKPESHDEDRRNDEPTSLTTAPTTAKAQRAGMWAAWRAPEGDEAVKALPPAAMF